MTDHLFSKDGQTYAGTHLIVDLWEAQNLDDPAILEQALRDATQATGATLLHLHVHRFQPQGVTGIAVLAESHISCHTWPELGYAAFDLFMCGAADPHAALPILGAAYQTDKIHTQTLLRGAHAPSSSWQKNSGGSP